MIIRYDGNAIGKFIGDTGRSFTGSFGFVIDGWGSSGIFDYANGPGWTVAITGDKILKAVYVTSSNIYPVSHEFRPVSTSALICLSY
ncbi:MAG: hypothetical protein FWD78_02865 [Treponema sp.]|nr:hypothetical protein [Treponema sp.]